MEKKANLNSLLFKYQTLRAFTLNDIFFDPWVLVFVCSNFEKVFSYTIQTCFWFTVYLFVRDISLKHTRRKTLKVKEKQ